jgi:hypothetical protein
METAGRRNDALRSIAVPLRLHKGTAMLLSSMLPSSLFGVDVSPYERVFWFGLGHLEREQRLNQRALLDWCCGPDPYTWVPRALHATSLLVEAAFARDLVQLMDHRAPWLPPASHSAGSLRPARRKPVAASPMTTRESMP